MRILCPLRVPLYENGIVWGLREEGCKVLMLDGKPIARRVLAEAVEVFRPDLLLSYGWWHGRLLIGDLAWIREHYGLPHVYWASDDPTHHLSTSRPMAEIADMVPTTTEEQCTAYRAMGKKTSYLQFACNPRIHHRMRPTNADRCEVVLIATNYSRYDPQGVTYRTRCARIMLSALIEKNHHLRVVGDGWDDPGALFHVPSAYSVGAVPYEQQARVFAAAQVVLGLQTECHWSTQTSCRIFEALGCGALFIAPSTRAAGNLFQPGKHLLVSHSPAETAALVRYYLAHHDDRERIAASGQLEVYRRHTYRQRARELLADVRKGL